MVGMRAVKRVRQIAALTLLVAWLPATSHCLLGAANWAPADCCQHEGEGGPAPVEGDDDCGTCGNVESGLYKISAKDTFHFAFTPTLASDFCDPPMFRHLLAADAQSAPRAPPGLIVRWQFLTRSARPGRAPAIL